MTWETGYYPQESLLVEAQHVNLAATRWVSPENEGTDSFLRVVYLTDKTGGNTRCLTMKYPSDKLFRNASGKAWTTGAVNCNFVRLQHRMGLVAMEGDQPLDSQKASILVRVSGR